MSRIPHLLARITQRTTPNTLSPRHLPHRPKPFTTTRSRLDEHNLSSPSRPQPIAPSSAPTRKTHPTYFPPVREEPRLSSRNFYRTHGRALFKALTLAFLTYQILYWAWLTLETEEIMDRKKRDIRSLEGEVRLLDEGRRGHGEAIKRVVAVGDSGTRMLEEGSK